MVVAIVDYRTLEGWPGHCTCGAGSPWTLLLRAAGRQSRHGWCGQPAGRGKVAASLVAAAAALCSG